MTQERMTRILTLLPEDKNADDLEPFLSRATMDVSRAATAKEATSLAASRRFDLAIARLPLPDMKLEGFLDTLRLAREGVQPIPIILMAEKSDFASGGMLNLDLPFVRPVAVDEGDEPLRHAISEALGVAARLAVRIPVRLDVGIDSGRSFRYCETRNLSRSGMLINSTQDMPVGTEFGFELILPYSYVSLRGFAEVVRKTDPDREHALGFGARFVELTKIDTVRIESFIRSKLTRPSFVSPTATDPTGLGL